MAGLSKKQLQTIDELDKRVEMCREFMNDWLLFNQIITAFVAPGANKVQLEGQFLKIKSKLAREHRVLRDTLMSDYGIDGNLMNIISSATSLESIHAQSEVAVKKLQTEWHRAFISINETLGVVENKKQRAEAGEKVYVAMPGQVANTNVGAGMSPGTKKTLIIVGLVIAAVLAVIFVPFPPFSTIKDFYVENLGLNR